MFPNIYKLSSSSSSSLPSSLWWGWGSCYLFVCCSLHMATWVVGYIDIVIYTGWPKKYFARYKFSVVVVDLPWRCLGANVHAWRTESLPENRPKWWQLCHYTLSYGNRLHRLQQRKDRRPNTALSDNACHICNVCGRNCRSHIGLFSHRWDPLSQLLSPWLVAFVSSLPAT